MKATMLEHLISATASGRLRWTAYGEGNYIARAGNTQFEFDKTKSVFTIKRFPGVGSEFVAQRYPFNHGGTYQQLLEMVEQRLGVPSADQIESAAEQDLLGL